mgnify:CR=1 FL=1
MEASYLQSDTGAINQVEQVFEGQQALQLDQMLNTVESEG